MNSNAVSNPNFESNDNASKSWSNKNKFETIIIGDAYCGKTSYLKSLIADQNDPSLLDTFLKENEFVFRLETLPKKGLFVIRDTANQERFRSLTQSYYRKAECIILAFSLENYESYVNLNNWYQDVLKYCRFQDKFAIILVGLRTKTGDDITNGAVSSGDQVDPEYIQKFVRENKYIISYCVIDLNLKTNLTKPFEIFLEYFTCNDASFNPNRRSTTPSPFYNNIQQRKSIINSDQQQTPRKLKKSDQEKSCCNIL